MPRRERIQLFSHANQAERRLSPVFIKSSGPEESRTPYLVNANDALYQMSYGPYFCKLFSFARTALLVGPPGIEPGLYEPESYVLPVYYGPSGGIISISLLVEIISGARRRKLCLRPVTRLRIAHVCVC